MTTDGPVANRLRALAVAREMDWMRGLRAAVALCIPLVVGDALGMANLGWAALGGFEAILSDQGGPYRGRLESLLTLSVGGAAGVFVGALAGGSLHWALPVTVTRTLPDQSRASENRTKAYFDHKATSRPVLNSSVGGWF